MNSKKAKQLSLEHGQSQIHIRALEDRLEKADRQLAESKGNLAVVCMAFKKYIVSTHAVTDKPLTDGQVVEILNRLVKETADEVNASFQSQSKRGEA